MRTLLGVVVGGLLGGALIAILTSQLDVQKSWPILLAGLVAGIAMRLLASDDHASYLRGALAALATVLAMIGGPLVGAKLISQKTLSVANVVSTNSGSEDDAAATSEAGNDLEAKEPVMPSANLIRPRGVIGAPQGDLNPMEAILMAAGCLIAYQIGKGSEAAAKVTDPEEGSPSEEAKQETSEQA